MSITRPNNPRCNLPLLLLFLLTSEASFSAPASYISLHPISVAGKVGYIDAQGRLVVEPQFEDAEPVGQDGLAEVCKDGMWGVIDVQGKVVVAPRYDRIAVCDSQVIGVRVAGKLGFIDRNGQVLFEPKFDGGQCFHGSTLAPIQRGAKWDVMDRRGRLILEGLSSFPRISIKDGRIGFTLGEKWGFADLNGAVVVEPQYDEVLGFGGGVAPVRIGGKWGTIDRHGKKIVAPAFDRILISESGLAVVRREGKDGSLSAKGKMVIKPRFDHLGFFENGMAMFRNEGKFGYVGESGRIVVAPQFEQAGPFSEGLAPVMRGKKWGFIDTKGVFVIPPQFEHALSFRSGFAKVQLHGDGGYIDHKGRIIAMPIVAGPDALLLGQDGKVLWPPNERIGSVTYNRIVWDIAVSEYDLPIVMDLQKRGVRPENPTALLIRAFERHSSNRSRSDESREAFSSRAIGVVRTLVELGGDLNLAMQKSPDYGLRGQMISDPNLALALVELGADVRVDLCADRARGPDTLLLRALWTRHEGLVRALLAKGVDPDAACKDGVMPLQYVLSYKAESGEPYDRRQWLEILLEAGADPNATYRGVPILFSVPEGDAESARVLVKYGAKLAGCCMPHKFDGKERQIGVITWAVHAERDDLLSLALAHPGQRLETCDSYAIVVAVEQRRPAAVRQLLASGANPNEKIDRDAFVMSLLHLAVKNEDISVAEELIRKGADTNATMVRGTGYSVFESAGIHMDTGFTPLMMAAAGGDTEMVKLLLRHGADVNRRTESGRTALMLAVGEGMADLLRGAGAIGK